METEIGFGLVGSLCILCGRRIRNTGREINKACARGRDCEEREVLSTLHALPTPSRPALVIALHQERIKGTEKASAIHTLFHR